MRSKGLLALCLSALCLTGAASAEITLSGTVVSRETAAVTADVGGAVEEVYVREGEWIEAGDASPLPAYMLRWTALCAACLPRRATAPGKRCSMWPR